jgi:HlyD family secretion protein
MPGARAPVLAKEKAMSTSTALVGINPGQLAPAAEAGAVATLKLSTRRPWRAGMAFICLFLGGFFLWGLTVPIAGGAVAPGVISPDGNRRTVQHFEGGIIAGLQVRDGDKVVAGQRLVVLESVQARTVFNALLHQHNTLVVMQARLQAEQDGRPEMVIPAELEASLSNPDLRRMLAAQHSMFATRRAAHQARMLVLRQRIEQSHEQIRAIEAQVASAAQQLALINDELRGKEQLLRSGLVPRPEILRLQRAQAEIIGRRGEHLGTIARTHQVIGETQMQILSLDADRLDKVAEQLDRVQVELAGIVERLQASRDVLARTVVAAPINGTVVNLRFKTIEGVIRPGEAILDIVPDEEKLLIDARVSPTDIDVVHAGLPAQVRLTAYSSRALPQIGGVVRTVSADRIVDQGTNQPYYLARVEVDREALERLGSAIELMPGMPAEVLIVRKERTMVGYLLEPFRDAFRRSFREV